MTMVNVNHLRYPRRIVRPASGTSGQSWSGLSGNSLTLDSTNDGLAWVGKSPVDDTLTDVYFRTGTVPAGGGDTVDVRIETVANGRPTGTLFSTSTNVLVTVADGDDNVWKQATLDAGAVLSHADEFAIVIASSAGTPSIPVYVANPSFDITLYPILLQAVTSATYIMPATNNGGYSVMANFQSEGFTFLQNLLPLDGDPTLSAFNSSSALDERALKFVLPFKASCCGIGVGMGNFTAGSQATGSLWPATSSSDAMAWGQSVLDGDFPYTNSDDGWVEFRWASTTLAKDTVYYAGVRSNTAANVTVYELPTTSTLAEAVKAFGAPTSTWHLAARAWDNAGAAGAWNEVSTHVFPLFYLILDKIDDGSAAAGGGGNANILLGSVIT